VEPDARAQSRGDELLDPQIARIDRLQLGRDQPDAALENLQRYARLDALAPQRATACHAQIPVERLDQTGFAAAVCAVHEPAIAAAYLERQIAQHPLAFTPDIRAPQADQYAAIGACRVMLARAGARRCP